MWYNYHGLAGGRVADPGGEAPDSTLEENPDPDPTVLKKLDPDPI